MYERKDVTQRTTQTVLYVVDYVMDPIEGNCNARIRDEEHFIILPIYGLEKKKLLF